MTKITLEEEEKPEYNKSVLIRYIKGYKGNRKDTSGTYYIQGYFEDEAIRAANYSKNMTVEDWRRNGYGETWFDYSGRQIESLTANKVIEWAYI